MNSDVSRDVHTQLAQAEVASGIQKRKRKESKNKKTSGIQKKHEKKNYLF
jgi:hypothetical protein